MTARRRSAARLYRDLVLTAAEQEFARVGFAETKVATIAKTADLSLATVYKTFSGKDEIWDELHADADGSPARPRDRAGPRPPPPRSSGCSRASARSPSS